MIAKLQKLISFILTLAVLMTCTIVLPKPVLASTYSSLAAGYNYTLVIKTNGELWAWGDNTYGQLGIGAATSCLTPVQVIIGANLKVLSVATSFNHTLAITDDGTPTHGTLLWAWGNNSLGQLGNGTTINRTTPMQINVMSGVKNVVAGRSHSLAIKNDDTLWAWGDNKYGQLGLGTTDSSITPSPIRVMINVKNVAAGDYHSLAISNTDGKLWAWGDNRSGQLGDGTTTGRATPTPVKIKTKVMSNVKSVTAGYGHSLAITDDGALYSWGNNGSGQLGDGTTINKLNPVKVMSKVLSMASVNYHSLAIDKAGTLWAWGNNGYGQLGDGTFTTRLKPVKIMSKVMSIAAGNGHSLAIDKAGKLYSWGDNRFGQLDDPTTGPPYPIQVRVSSLNKVKSMAAGYGHSLAIQEDGTLWAWGSNDYKQLGNGRLPSSQILKATKVLNQVLSVATGLNFTLAIQEDGTLLAWGDNGYGQLGVGTTKNRATPVKVISGVSNVVAGDNHSLAIKEDGTLWAWGDNSFGQLGDGTTKDRLSPVKVLSDVKSVATSFDHTLALKEDGTLWAWGDNSFGQLGDGTMTNSLSPVLVMLGTNSGIMNMAVGRGYSLAIMTDGTPYGTLYSWGDNSFGQLGDRTMTNSSSPVPVWIGVNSGVMSGVMDVTAGDYHCLALMDDGKLYSWGDNSFGQLGIGTLTMSSIPIQVGSKVKNVVAGDYHSLAIKDDGTPYGTLWAWGLNSRGQWGNGTTTTRTTP